AGASCLPRASPLRERRLDRPRELLLPHLVVVGRDAGVELDRDALRPQLFRDRLRALVEGFLPGARREAEVGRFLRGGWGLEDLAASRGEGEDVAEPVRVPHAHLDREPGAVGAAEDGPVLAVLARAELALGPGGQLLAEELLVPGEAV